MTAITKQKAANCLAKGVVVYNILVPSILTNSTVFLFILIYHFFFFQEHMIVNEVSILRRIKHPNVVRLIQEFDTTSEIYLVMELVNVSVLFRWQHCKTFTSIVFYLREEIFLTQFHPHRATQKEMQAGCSTTWHQLSLIFTNWKLLIEILSPKIFW